MKEQPVRPMILCADIWPRRKLDSSRMQAYKTVEATGIIRITKVTYSRPEQKVVVEYLSSVPQEWAREELKKAVIIPEDRQLAMPL